MWPVTNKTIDRIRRLVARGQHVTILTDGTNYRFVLSASFTTAVRNDANSAGFTRCTTCKTFADYVQFLRSSGLSRL